MHQPLSHSSHVLAFNQRSSRELIIGLLGTGSSERSTVLCAITQKASYTLRNHWIEFSSENVAFFPLFPQQASPSRERLNYAKIGLIFLINYLKDFFLE